MRTAGSGSMKHKPLAPLVSRREGEELRRRIWSEIIEGLKKDLPEVADIVNSLEV